MEERYESRESRESYEAEGRPFEDVTGILIAIFRIFLFFKTLNTGREKVLSNGAR